MLKPVMYFFFLLSFTQAQVPDTLKYYYPYDPDVHNSLAFVEECGAPGYCEPIAVWFTPDSSVTDSSLKYYSIKTIRFCFAGNIYEDTTFTVHFGDNYPDAANQMYKRYISVDVSETNQNFGIDGIYKFKDFDVSGVAELQNIGIDTSFWVVLHNKVWSIWNTFKDTAPPPLSNHSFLNGLPDLIWNRIPGDWIVEAIVEYHKYVPIKEPKNINLIPEQAKLFQNYPNPFNAQQVTLKYQLFKPGYVNLDLYNNLGKKVKTLVSKNQKGGVYDVHLNLKELSSGVYFYVLKINGVRADSKRLTFIK